MIKKREGGMRRCTFFSVFLIAVTVSAYGQYFEYVSLGYNTVERTRNGDEISTRYYFLNHSQFRNMASEKFYSSLETEEEGVLELPHGSLEGVWIGYFFGGNNDFIFKNKEGYSNNTIDEVFRVLDGKLVYAETGGYVSRKIEYSDTGLTVVLSRQRDEIVIKYYNMPENKLYDMFMTAMVERMKQKISNLNRGYENHEYLEDDISKMTKMELAIFRNCLFAVHRYAFRQKTWIDFMSSYFSHNYEGSRSNAEAMAAFSNAERDLLQMIQKYEAK